MGYVIPFPSAKDRRKVRAVAAVALGMDGRLATRFVRQTCRSLFLELTIVRGVPPRVARVDVKAFDQAVQAEIIRQAYSVHDTGGAA